MSTFIGNPLLAFVQQPGVAAQTLDPTSRYYNLPTATIEINGRKLIYLTRRLLPDPSSFSLLRMHTVGADERLDQAASSELGDPLQFWRICDANGAMRPWDLTEPSGQTLRITLPAGIPGVRNG